MGTLTVDYDGGIATPGAQRETASSPLPRGRTPRIHENPGGVSVCGLGRFPVTLYYEQWVRLLYVAGDLRAFLEVNKSRLKLKKET